MNESRTKVICEYYGMENLDFCKEKLRRDNQKKNIWEKYKAGVRKEKWGLK